MPATKMWKVPELANRWNVSPKSIWQWISNKQIGVIRLGRAVRIPQSEVERWVKEGTTAPISACTKDELCRQLCRWEALRDSLSIRLADMPEGAQGDEMARLFHKSLERIRVIEAELEGMSGDRGRQQ